MHFSNFARNDVQIDQIGICSIVESKIQVQRLVSDVHSFRRRNGEPDPAVPGDGGAAGGRHQGGGQLGDPGRLAARPGRPRRSSGARLNEVSHVPKRERNRMRMLRIRINRVWIRMWAFFWNRITIHTRIFFIRKLITAYNFRSKNI